MRLRPTPPAVAVDDVPERLRQCVVEDWAFPEELPDRDAGPDEHLAAEAAAFMRWLRARLAWRAETGAGRGDLAAATLSPDLRWRRYSR